MSFQDTALLADMWGADRALTLKSEALRPIIIWLTDPSEAPAIPLDQLNKAIAALESWLVRRACVRAGNKDYRDVTLRLLAALRDHDRTHAGDVIERYLAAQSGEGSYWPSDDDVRLALRGMPIYKRFQRGRLRMLLEAIEDHRRGWDGKNPKHESRVRRGNLTIEHLMPQHWETHWEPPRDGANRDDLVQSLGNLTLTSGSLNSDVSNGPWFTKPGHVGKYEKLSDSKYTSVSLTQDALRLGEKGWTDATIRTRTESMIDTLLEVWPVPADAVGLDRSARGGSEVYIGITELLAAGLLEPGQTLYARRPQYRDVTATVTEDGQLKVGDATYWSPTGAGKAASGGKYGSWSYWVTDPDNGVRLRDLRDQYADERGLRAKDGESGDD
jgi:hypothetical protein